MNAKFNARQHRLFNHAINCLSRFGDKLSILCLRSGDKDHVLRLSAINATGSGFCAFFFTHDFFDEYHAKARRYDLQLQIKSVQSILRNQLNRHLEQCELQLIGEDDDEDSTECRLAFKLHGEQGVVKTHKLTYEAKAGLFPRDVPGEANRIKVKSKTIQELLEHFATKGNGEITMHCTRDTCHLTSTSEEFNERDQRRRVSTKVEVKANLFHLYEIGEECRLTFALREFKAGVALADHLRLPLELRFSKSGSALSVLVECSDAVLAHIFIATSSPDADAAPEDEATQGNSVPQAPTTHLSQASRSEQDGHTDDAMRSGREAASAGQANPHDTTIAPTPQMLDVVQSGRAAANDADRVGPLVSTQMQGRAADRASEPLATSTPATRHLDDVNASTAAASNVRPSLSQGSATQNSASLFRGMEGDPALSQQQHALSDSDTRHPAASAPAPARRRPSYEDELPSRWDYDSTMLSFDEESRLAAYATAARGRRDEEGDSSQGATDDESDCEGCNANSRGSDRELPSTQHTSSSISTAGRYRPLF